MFVRGYNFQPSLVFVGKTAPGGATVKKKTRLEKKCLAVTNTLDYHNARTSVTTKKFYNIGSSSMTFKRAICPPKIPPNQFKLKKL